jgi:hypothetical protein
MSALGWKLIELMLMGIANSVVIAGWYKACYYEWEEGSYTKIDEDSKEVFWKLRYWAAFYIRKKWLKPLFTCVICMASVHGTWFYWLCEPFTIESLKWWFPYLIGLCGYNYVYISSRI